MGTRGRVRKKVIKQVCAGAKVRGQAKKRGIFLEGKVFFLLLARRPFGGTCPLMGNPVVFVKAFFNIFRLKISRKQSVWAPFGIHIT